MFEHFNWDTSNNYHNNHISIAFDCDCDCSIDFRSRDSTILLVYIFSRMSFILYSYGQCNVYHVGDRVRNTTNKPRFQIRTNNSPSFSTRVYGTRRVPATVRNTSRLQYLIIFWPKPYGLDTHDTKYYVQTCMCVSS